MIRVLHIVTSMDRAGLETFLMNCYRHMDRDQVQFDFLVHRDFRADYDDEIQALGGIIHRLPRLNPIHPGYYRALDRFFRDHPEYRIVHCHLDCMSAIPLSIAKSRGIPLRIAHGHSCNQDRNWKYPLKRFFMHITPKVANAFFACSRETGAWMFPNQTVQVINNGIDADAFRFQPRVRSTIRASLGLTTELAICHIGRFMPAKNHDFLIDVFAALTQLRPDAKLFLMGTGPLEPAIREKVDALGLRDSVHFLGVRTDVNQLLQAMDLFLMPSRYEGLGIAAIEAQASGLPCILSDTIPEECQVTEVVFRMSLTQSPEAWAHRILSSAQPHHSCGPEDLRNAGFDISHTARYLQTYYLSHWKD